MGYTEVCILVLSIYVAVTIYFSIRGMKQTHTMKDYAIGKGFSPWIVALSLAASITSAATFIINPGFVAYYGFSALLAMSIMLPLGLYISLVILSKSFRTMGLKSESLTLSQWIGKRFDSKAFALYMACISLLLITFIVLICVGLTKVLSNALSSSETWVLIAIVIFVFGYMMVGGANTMVYTNTIQAILMILVAIILLVSGHEHFENGISGFVTKINQLDPQLSSPFNASSPLFRDFFEVIFCNFVIGVAVVCQPHIITKSLMLKSDKDVNKYLLISIIVESIFFAVLFAGFYARLTFPELKNGETELKIDGIFSAYVVKEFSVYTGIIVIMGLIAAGISTLEGLIQSLSTTITNDIILPLSKKELNTKQISILNKIVIALLGLIATYISLHQLKNPNLSVGILAQNGVYAFFSAAFVPVLFGIFVKNANKIAVFSASISAIVTHFAIYYMSLSKYTTGAVKNPAVAATYAIITAVTLALILQIILKPKKVN
ncbi:MAG TPA: sodium:solute symporter [Saprospiraceae bacterium]|jgi:sodium/pantothenate symporter|nr:sodium:solute symporter [Saprospiraceae bacterium]